MKPNYNYNQEKQQRHLLGLGLDNQDGHKRVTKSKNFSLIGGSEETHEIMVEKTIKLEEKLKSRGKTIADAGNEEFIGTAEEVGFTIPKNHPSKGS